MIREFTYIEVTNLRKQKDIKVNPKYLDVQRILTIYKVLISRIAFR